MVGEGFPTLVALLLRLLVNESEFALTSKMSGEIYNAGSKTVTQGSRASRGVVLELGARTIVTTGHPFHLDVYDNYR